MDRPSFTVQVPLDPETIVRKLVELGERHALNQEERAQRVGISLRHYKRLEGGNVGSPRLTTVRKVADAYGLDPATFLTEIANDVGSFGDRLARIESKLDQLLNSH